LSQFTTVHPASSVISNSVATCAVISCAAPSCRMAITMRHPALQSKGKRFESAAKSANSISFKQSLSRMRSNSPSGKSSDNALRRSSTLNAPPTRSRACSSAMCEGSTVTSWLQCAASSGVMSPCEHPISRMSGYHLSPTASAIPENLAALSALAQTADSSL
jgi:hypothetical protein